MHLKRHANIQRYKITDKMLDEMHAHFKGSVTGVSKRTKEFLKKFPIERRKGNLFLGEKQLVSVQGLDKILNEELLGSACPLSCEGAYFYLREKYCGCVTRQKVTDWIKSLESWQLQRTRPPNPDTTRGTYRHYQEGNTRYLLQRGGKNALGADLMYIPKQWSKFKFFLCVVHLRSGYCWFEPLVERESKDLVAPFKRVLADVKKRFGGEVKYLHTDPGVEFLKDFKAFLDKQGILHDNEFKSYHSERKIQQFGRTMGQLLGVLPKNSFAKALVMTLEKLNNTRSRVTGKKPVSMTSKTKLKKSRVLRKGRRKAKKQQEFSVGDNVRFLKKHAELTNTFYKSYGTTSRKPKHENWSRVVKIKKVKLRRGEVRYQLEDDKWRKPWELQLVKGEVRILDPKKAPTVLSSAQQKKAQKIQASLPKTRSSKVTNQLKSELGSYWKPVRSKRQRKKVNYKV